MLPIVSPPHNPYASEVNHSLPICFSYSLNELGPDHAPTVCPFTHSPDAVQMTVFRAKTLMASTCQEDSLQLLRPVPSPQSSPTLAALLDKTGLKERIETRHFFFRKALVVIRL
ncbi:hypothetical protein BgiBS90_035878 [Biomphalaria glabrata]|nr:hypothetical protein BgiBS90_035878 [Biomphalaria glabrata]